MSPRTGARRRRLGSIRLSLFLLALVPSVTLAAMWGVTTTQMFSEGLRLREQTELSRSTGAMGTEATLALQRERSLSAVWLTSRPAGSRPALEAQRAKTDVAVAKLVAHADDIQRAPARVRDRLYSVVASVSSLEYYRGQVDAPVDITAAQALDQYTSIIDDQIHAFQELSQVDDGDLTSQAGPLIALEHAAELVSEEDLNLTLAGPAGRMDDKAWAEFAQLVNSRRWLVQDQIVPSLTGAAKAQTEEILTSYQWQTLEAVEDKVLAARTKQGENGQIALPDVQKEWRAALIDVSDAYEKLIRQQTAHLLQRSADEAHGLLLTAASLSAGGLVALLLCVGMSWRITRSLSRRLRGLRMATLSLAHERLPDVVARLDRGETVDVDAETPPLDYGGDELGQVAKAFNTAQRTAVLTAVELADTRRGFEKVILGIARQSQNLVNLQLSKLDALERRHQDPDVLAGLYELDSTASQLRRYEENLVIISGGRPGRSWSEPVALTDILRSAVGEVAEYRRVEVHTEEEVCIAPPAVADVIHLLAELIDNATSYSPAPGPVGVRATLVARGLAIEVEDRGLGMSAEDYASFNAQLAVPPQFDVVALADDLRLGMFVIARLATRHGIGVTLRSSPYGGTTAIVLLPHEVVVRESPDPEDPAVGISRAATSAGPVAEAATATATESEAEAEAETEAGAGRGEADDPPPGQGAPGPAREGHDDAREAVGGEPAHSPHAARTAPPAAHGGPGVPREGLAAADESPKGARSVSGGENGHGRPRPDEDASPVPGQDPERDGHGGNPNRVAPDRDRSRDDGRPGDRTPSPLPVRNTSGRAHEPSAGAAGAPAAGSRPGGLTPLPRRIPQTSLADELREDASCADTVEDDRVPDDFTAERAASSLAGFQRGTLRAHADAGRPPSDPRKTTAEETPGPPVTAAGAAKNPTPPADRS
ncbi:nitrate- and nitrite sensing domain-containing protein [Streptomyces sp. ID05-04B]|uniref:sensor histidine kinase n=1 Tax=unclassified Streptomyces TaxID=2593676 RepID=UPI000D1B648E|nr:MULTISPECIES: nitrate- and nitrite sensing domain-containing protein [unclassified Streptomyces]AVV44955.1 histidine kinase [Streptomyces sp. P3]MDX5564832.1 nitrate- and nitrite sensing domain-containing protein [Streptomyces sp. ID05-04B]